MMKRFGMAGKRQEGQEEGPQAAAAVCPACRPGGLPDLSELMGGGDLPGVPAAFPGPRR